MNIIEFVQKELRLEADAINQVAERMNGEIETAIDLIYNCTGKVVVTGMGKTGIIGRKIAATLASTGTTAIFLHAGEGIHGDLGILQKEDVVIAISYSGNSSELVSIIPYMKFNRIPIIAITGNLNSKLAKNSDVVIDGWVPKESEPFGLVPTASTTVALALGDAMAVALLKKRDFQETDFARFHPGGTIGRKLLLRVEDVMYAGKDIPIVNSTQKLGKAILKMIDKNLGGTIITNEEGKLIGIITDGDLKRILLKNKENIMESNVTEGMTCNPKCMKPSELAVEALNVMEDNNITMLPVVDADNKPIGLLHMHDLIKAGVVG